MKKQWILVCFLLLVPLIGLGIHVGEYPYPSGSSFSDFTITHDPYLYFLRSEVFVNGEIPLWNPNLFCGTPFAANPLSSMAYPFIWAAVLLGSPIGLNLLTILHLWLGGIGMIWFLKNEGMDPVEAFIGGIAFMMMPKLIAHYGLGHITLVWAVCWSPWLLWSAELKPGLNRFGHYLLPLFFLGLTGLADIRWLPYAGILWGVMRLREMRKTASTSGTFWVKWVNEVVLVFIGLLLLISPVLLPLAEFSQLSTRADLSSSEATVLGLPLEHLIGILIPDFQGYAEWTLYPGIFVVLLCAWGLTIPEVRKRLWFWLGMGAVSLLLALSDYLPFSEWISQVPGLNMLRVPSRSLFLLGIAVSMIAAECVRYLREKLRKNAGNGLPVMGLMGLVVVLSIGIVAAGGDWSAEYLWAAGVGLAGAVLILLAKDRKISSSILGFCAAGLLLIDFAGADLNLLSYKKQSEVFASTEKVLQSLPKSDEKYRIFDYSFSLEPSALIRNGYETASGIDPLQIKAYADLAREAAGIDFNGYSVTIPFYQENGSDDARLSVKPDTKLLGILNVKYVVSRYEIQADGLTQLEVVTGLFIYENQEFLPRAWIQDSGKALGEDAQNVEVTSWDANRIVINTTRSGLLVLSMPEYPGWNVAIDGNPARFVSTEEGLIAVDVPEGAQQVVLVFKPVSVYWGFGIGCAAWLALIGVWFIGRKK